MNKSFDYLIVQRRILGIWFEVGFIYRSFGDDCGLLFRYIRDIYVKKWGVDNVRIKMVWKPELYDGKGYYLK